MAAWGFLFPVRFPTQRGKDASENKGYAFVTFRTKELASTAIKELNTKELKDPQNYRRNHGFAFIEYYNHDCAEYSRQKMLNPKFKLDNNAPTVSRVDPKNVESSASSQMKVAHVKNLPKNVTQDELENIFEHHGKIIKVVLPPAKGGHKRSRFGFVHFADRSSVMKALKNIEKYVLDVLECSLAKQQADQKPSGRSSNNQKAALLLKHHPPRVGYGGLVGGAYGGLGARYGAAIYGQPPLIYGRGPSTAEGLGDRSLESYDLNHVMYGNLGTWKF
uniref:RRM domain-containing protein n=1 Tax=Lactuca sativa TaxID=4236 RepID=A0A9R1WJL5_LACSA|nr:hypothetical protein LSAT_V11C200092080 [Lactuca sativa]